MKPKVILTSPQCTIQNVCNEVGELKVNDVIQVEVYNDDHFDQLRTALNHIYPYTELWMEKFASAHTKWIYIAIAKNNAKICKTYEERKNKD